MVQFLSDNIDQLDLAIDQLAVADRNFDRFALMLIDNVVELTLHRFAQEKARENDMFRHWGAEPIHNQNLLGKALGQAFDNKAKCAWKLGLIDNSVYESVLTLHSYRNTAYHKGLRHEGILHSLAIFYFRNACKLLKSYEPSCYARCGSDRISLRARKYIGELRWGFGCDYREIFKAAYARLEEVAASMEEDMIGDLSADMAATIDTIDDMINFLADYPPCQNRDEVIVAAQAQHFAFTEQAKEFAQKKGFKVEAETVGAYIQWIKENYNWSIKLDPIPGWRTCLQSLKNEKDYHKALKKYHDFMGRTEDIRSLLSEADAQLNAHIDQQVDTALGK